MDNTSFNVCAHREDMHATTLLLKEGDHIATTKVRLHTTGVLCCAVSTDEMCCTLTASGRRREGVGDSYSCSTCVPRLYNLTQLAFIISGDKYLCENFLSIFHKKTHFPPPSLSNRHNPRFVLFMG